MHNKYVLISPCRNEGEFLRRSMDSILGQTVLPSLWVIVDDGSTDDTPSILAEYAAQHPWIRIVTRQNRGFRSVGPGVIEAFYAGYRTVDINEFDFVCKLDLDIIFPPQYFATLLQRMEADPRVGCCSGKPYYVDAGSGRLVSEKCGDENAVGASKFYRTSCFLQIGGFVRQVMWDGIDGHRCRMFGWIAVSWDDPALRFTHLRPMGSSQNGLLAGRMRHGFGQYFMGTGFVYMTASSVYRMSRPPLMLGGLAMWWGYVRSALSGEQRLRDDTFRRYLHRYQRLCLLWGKQKTVARLIREGASIWDPAKPGYPFPELTS